MLRYAMMFFLSLGIASPGFAAPLVMPPITTDPGGDPNPTILLGEIITTIQSTDGILEARKGSVSVLANGAYSANINYVLDGVVYRVNLVVNPDGSAGTINTAGQSLIRAISTRPALRQVVSQQNQSIQQAMLAEKAAANDPNAPIARLSPCAESWIGLAISVISDSWWGAAWGIFKIITTCF